LNPSFTISTNKTLLISIIVKANMSCEQEIKTYENKKELEQKQKFIDQIECFIKKNKPLDYIEPMSPNDQRYAKVMLAEFKKRKPGTLCGLGLSSYTSYAFYKSYENIDYFVVFNMGEIFSYAHY
jgi:hypothetical protein